MMHEPAIPTAAPTASPPKAKASGHRRFTVTLSLLAIVCCAAAADPQPSPVDAAKTAAEKAAAEKAAAEKALADKIAAAKAAEEKAAAAKAEADKAVAAKAELEKALAEKAAAAKAEADKAAAAKAEADKAGAEKVAAEKTVAEKERALQAARETILAEEAFAANEAVEKARKDRQAAEKTVTDKAGAVQKTAGEAAAAKAAADKANADKTAAEKTLAEKGAAAQAATEKLAAAKTAAEKAAGDKALADQVAAAQAALDKANAEKAQAEKAVADLTNAAKAAADKAAAAQAALDKANAEKAAADSDLAQKIAAIPGLLDKAAIAQAQLVGGLPPMPASAWTYEKARHLLWRAGFGGSPEEVERLHAMGLHAAVEHLVNYTKHPEPNVHVEVSLPERETPYEHRLVEAERNKLGGERTTRRFQQLAALRQWWLRRMAETQRPLEEKMTLFWHGHCAVSFQKHENPHAMYRQNRMFREFGGLNYAAILRGTAQDPAMITYLDNHVNFKGSGNENFGREILELFSMGEGQGYNEQDLREASRALTGYSYEHWTGQFKFIAPRHDETSKTIFGRAGNWGGDDLVDLILQQPATAKFIATKLFRYFVHDHPSPETIEAMARVLRIHHYELQPMLRNLFLSEEFYSGNAMASHIKSPVELMIGTIRTLGLKEVNYGAVDGAIQNMGQTLFEPPNVKGWDGGRDWINASRILMRYNAVASLVDQGSVDLVAALQHRGFKQPAEVVDHLAKGFLVLPLTSAKRAELIQFLGELPPADQWPAQKDNLNAKLRAVLATMLSTAEYQLAQAPPHKAEAEL